MINEISTGRNTGFLGWKDWFTKRSSQDTLTAYIFLLPNILGFFLFTLGPVVASFAVSFFNWRLLEPPVFVGWENYQTMFIADPLFYKAVFNTLFFVATYVPLNIIISVGVAQWLSGKLKGVNFYRLLFFMPILTPAVAVGAVWKYIYQPDFGLIDSVLAKIGMKGPFWLGDPNWALFSIVIMTLWFQMGWNMVIFIAAIKNIPAALFECAEIDGSGKIRQFFKITLPMISPAIFFGVVMTVISSFQVFDQIYVMAGFNANLGNPMNATRTISIHIFENGFRFIKMGYAAACSWALFLIIFIMTVIQFYAQKKWVYYDM